MASSAGKRERERQKQEKAQAKSERRAARLAADVPAEADGPVRTEAELIEELGALHRDLEDGRISPEEFEERRDGLNAAFGQFT